jgi:hypothetical protein
LNTACNWLIQRKETRANHHHLKSNEITKNFMVWKLGCLETLETILILQFVNVIFGDIHF